MSTITIQGRLVASEPTRHQLWTLMAEGNTPLINELLAQINQHPDFETWRQQAKLKAGIVKQLYEPLRTDPRFSGQPGRFYTSAIALVDYIYKSWFKIQQRLQRKLEGQTRGASQFCFNSTQCRRRRDEKGGHRQSEQLMNLIKMPRQIFKF